MMNGLSENPYIGTRTSIGIIKKIRDCNRWFIVPFQLTSIAFKLEIWIYVWMNGDDDIIFLKIKRGIPHSRDFP